MNPLPVCVDVSTSPTQILFWVCELTISTEKLTLTLEPVAWPEVLAEVGVTTILIVF